MSVKIYNTLLKYRTKLFQPIVILLTKLNISANMLTAFSYIATIPCVLYVNSNPILFFVWWMISVQLLDVIDGPLARYQKKNTDRGKFIDWSKDNILMLYFMFALMYINYFDSFIFSVFIVINLVHKLLSTTYKSIHTKSNWFFYSSSDDLSHVLAWMIPIIFLIEFFIPFNYKTEALLLGISISFLSSIFYYFKIFFSKDNKFIEKYK